MNNLKGLRVSVFGTSEFSSRLSAQLNQLKVGLKVFQTTFSDAWSNILSDRPSLIFIEIGFSHSEKEQLWLRQFLTQLRERFNSEIYVVVVLNDSRKLAYGGDLLFKNEDNFDPSNFVDSFLVKPPEGLPACMSVGEQAQNLLKFYSNELTRRAQGKVSIPTLNASDWVQSLADPASRELWMQWLPRYASYTNESPIVSGATGTGKTKLARAIHFLSERKGPFVSMTPRDFSSSELVQAELFGAVAGAYTGAVDKWGLVKSAEKGTLFIDELQSIDKDLQGKLITFIENKAYRRVGSAETIAADVRFVFATNRSIVDMVKSDILREDFAYRLERVELNLAQLESRKLDIPAAIAFSLAKIRRQRPQASPVIGFNSQSYRLLFCHDWPGNLRQLENTVAQACELADMRDQSIVDETIITHVLKSKISGPALSASEVFSKAADKFSRLALERGISKIDLALQEFADMLRDEALSTCSGNIEQAAQLIGESEKLLKLYSKTKPISRENL